jgi:hypothetical protein
MLTPIDEKHIPLTIGFIGLFSTKDSSTYALFERAKSWNFVVLHNVPVVLPYPKTLRKKKIRYLITICNLFESNQNMQNDNRKESSFQKPYYYPKLDLLL